MYLGPQGVLTGSMRAAQEDREKAEKVARLEEREMKTRQLERRRAALEAQIEALRAEFKANEEEAMLIRTQDEARERILGQERAAAALRRGADKANGSGRQARPAL